MACLNKTYIWLALAIIFSACGFSPEPRRVIIGNWIGDASSALSDPEVKKESEGNPMGDFFLELIEETYKTIGVRISGERFETKIQIPGETPISKSFPYKVASSDRDTITLEGLSGEGAGEKLVIKIIDRDHIRITTNAQPLEQFPLILKRASQSD